MAENTKVEDYTESEKDREKGHQDTRAANLGCEEPAGCPRDVDVAG
jgi:hypothetical protein